MYGTHMYRTGGYPLDLGLRRSQRRARRQASGRLFRWTLRRVGRDGDSYRQHERVRPRPVTGAQHS